MRYFRHRKLVFPTPEHALLFCWTEFAEGLVDPPNITEEAGDLIMMLEVLAHAEGVETASANPSTVDLVTQMRTLTECFLGKRPYLRNNPGDKPKWSPHSMSVLISVMISTLNANFVAPDGTTPKGALRHKMAEKSGLTFKEEW